MTQTAGTQGRRSGAVDDGDMMSDEYEYDDVLVLYRYEIVPAIVRAVRVLQGGNVRARGRYCTRTSTRTRRCTRFE